MWLLLTGEVPTEARAARPLASSACPRSVEARGRPASRLTLGSRPYGCVRRGTRRRQEAVSSRPSDTAVVLAAKRGPCAWS